MNMKKLLSVAAMAMICLASCKKTDPVNNNGNNNNNNGNNNNGGYKYESFAREYESLAPQVKQVAIDAAAGASIYGNSGTRYVFPPNAFQTASGAIVTGTVNLELRECVRNTDFIFARMLTVSEDGLPLLSAGSVMVKATKDGSDVFIRPGMNFTVKMPTAKGPSADAMRYFRGITTSAIPGSIVSWAPQIDSMFSVIYDGDTISMFPDSVGFHNLDKYATGDFVNVDVKIDGLGSTTLSTTDVLGYYLIAGTLSAAQVSSSSFSSNTFKSVRILKNKTHIAIAVISGGDFYAGVLANVLATSGSTYTVTVSKTTPAAFKAMLAAL